jgi:hypothetical protein
VVSLRASLSPSPLLFSSNERVHEQGCIPPKWLGLGAPRGLRQWLLIVGIGAGHVDGKDAREGAPYLARQCSAHWCH